MNVIQRVALLAGVVIVGLGIAWAAWPREGPPSRIGGVLACDRLIESWERVDRVLGMPSNEEGYRRAQDMMACEAWSRELRGVRQQAAIVAGFGFLVGAAGFVVGGAGREVPSLRETGGESS